MERKIGEIFEVNGKWYQCVEANENDNCNACDLQGLCIRMQGKQHVGNCMNWRTDNKRTVYKKLEKVGEPFLYKAKQMQSYRRATGALICNWNNNLLLLEHGDSDIIDIEVVQSKEDMEWKVGEIKQICGEWYQCLESNGCDYCDLEGLVDCHNIACAIVERSDNKEVHFKKLKEVGKPYEKRVSDGTFSKFQRYRVYNSVVLPKEPYIYCNFIDSTVEIEIKQTKDMGERDDIRPYDEYFSEGTVSTTKHLAKGNLKSFDIEAAKAGKPVCTRDGRKVRIICFDKNDSKRIVALVQVQIGSNGETVVEYNDDGRVFQTDTSDNDLMMMLERKEGWAKIRKDINLYNTKEEADRKMIGNNEYVTAKVCWEE